MKFDGPITMEEVEKGAPFFFGGFLPSESLTSTFDVMHDNYKIVFAIVTKIHNINYNGDVYRLFELNMYDVDTIEYVGKHSLQEVLIETKINKSYFGIEFETVQEEAKFNLLRK